MNTEEFRNYSLSKKGVTESTPFPRLPDILVFKLGDKMFTGTDMKGFESFSIKCDPETIDQLRATFPALEEPSYFSKKHWCKVLIDGSVPDRKLYEWLDTSYDLVLATQSKKMKKQMKSED